MRWPRRQLAKIADLGRLRASGAPKDRDVAEPGLSGHS